MLRGCLGGAKVDSKHHSDVEWRSQAVSDELNDVRRQHKASLDGEPLLAPSLDMQGTLAHKGLSESDNSNEGARKLIVQESRQLTLP